MTKASSDKHEEFLQCLLHHSPHSSSIAKLIYTQNNSSYSSVLNLSIRNHRFSTPNTPKPILIITPSNISHIQAAVICSKSQGLQIRIRSGGHDFEGLSYVAYLPFIVVDLINLRSITVDVKRRTAWVQSAATLGELYYRIAEKSPTLTFPGGACPTVCFGGYLSGGGYGLLLRKYGLAADNVIDAYLVDANGEFHDRESMGEDLFWAIRGGGGGSFGIVVAWKVKLVPVPATVTFCSSSRTFEEDAINLIHQWQYVGYKLEKNIAHGVLTIGGQMTSEVDGKVKPVAIFYTSFLGKANKAVKILKEKFPQLGLKKEECKEASWVESVVIAANDFTVGEPVEALLNRSALIPPITSKKVKIKSDYVKEPMPKVAIEGIWNRVNNSQDIGGINVLFVPYGGRMSEISESEISFSHRAGNLFKIAYLTGWEDPSMDVETRHLNWIREIYSYMAPFVSKSPRSAYVNYRDLDIGSNSDKYGNIVTNHDQASSWGLKYYGNNFNRLVQIKTKVDPYNFFRHEQSIPIALSQEDNLVKLV
ncbi:hypothetical protein Csa_023331 [Cucumis sativus]|nr:hypothetical protein Csa_023331 [Cucumis sativus]